jgi:hypothetical protein
VKSIMGGGSGLVAASGGGGRAIGESERNNVLNGSARTESLRPLFFLMGSPSPSPLVRSLEETEIFYERSGNVAYATSSVSSVCAGTPSRLPVDLCFVVDASSAWALREFQQGFRTAAHLLGPKDTCTIFLGDGTVAVGTHTMCEDGKAVVGDVVEKLSPSPGGVTHIATLDAPFGVAAHAPRFTHVIMWLSFARHVNEKLCDEIRSSKRTDTRLSIVVCDEKREAEEANLEMGYRAAKANRGHFACSPAPHLDLVYLIANSVNVACEDWFLGVSVPCDAPSKAVFVGELDEDLAAEFSDSPEGFECHALRKSLVDALVQGQHSQMQTIAHQLSGHRKHTSLLLAKEVVKLWKCWGSLSEGERLSAASAHEMCEPSPFVSSYGGERFIALLDSLSLRL